MLIKLGITLIRIQRERWIETEEGDGEHGKGERMGERHQREYELAKSLQQRAS